MPYWSIVRCRDGHLFETPYLPAMSFKAVRLGPERFQRCPVGRHWVMVTRVPEEELTAAEVADARRHRTSPIP